MKKLYKNALRHDHSHHEALRTLRTLSTISVKEVINSHGKAKIFDILSNSLIKYFIQISF